MKQAIRQPVVHFPAELQTLDYIGDLYGYYHPSSNEYNVISWEDPPAPIGATAPTKIGRIVTSDGSPSQDVEDLVIGHRATDGLSFIAGGRTCKGVPYNLLQNIFSRNTGILETGMMLDKTAIISGCGSVGSLVAVELARAGVGNFVLVDNDTIAYHNLCRHQCGIQDVGKFKVDAVRERVLQVNPSAHIVTCVNILEGVEKQVFDEGCRPGSIIIGCADNREGDVYGSRIACLYRVPFVSIGLWERAFAGEIFYNIPGEMPCYVCPFGDDGGGISVRPSTNRRIYTTEEDLSLVNFEPGISTDISFVTLIAVKMIIDLLNRDTPGYIPRLIGNLAQFTLVCNTNDIRLGGEQAEIFSYPLQVTTSVEIGYKDPCPPCKLLG